MYIVQSPTLLDKKMPSLKSRDWHVLAGNRTSASAEGGDHSSKELNEQPVNSYSERDMAPPSACGYLNVHEHT